MFTTSFERVSRKTDPSDAAAMAAATTAWYDRRRAYRQLLHQKREQFLTLKIDAERSSPRQLWRSLMGRG